MADLSPGMLNCFPMPNFPPPKGALMGPTTTPISLLTTNGNIFLSLENTANSTENSLRQNSDFTAFYSLTVHTANISKWGLIAHTWDVSPWNRSLVHVDENFCHPLLSKILAISTGCKWQCAIWTKLSTTTDFLLEYGTWKPFPVITQMFHLSFSFNTIHGRKLKFSKAWKQGQKNQE